MFSRNVDFYCLHLLVSNGEGQINKAFFVRAQYPKCMPTSMQIYFEAASCFDLKILSKDN